MLRKKITSIKWRKPKKIVDPILLKLFKGHGLAARNCGLIDKKRQAIQLLVTDNQKKAKMIADKASNPS